jgi:hypothetical protein
MPVKWWFRRFFGLPASVTGRVGMVYARANVARTQTIFLCAATLFDFAPQRFSASRANSKFRGEPTPLVKIFRTNDLA